MNAPQGSQQGPPMQNLSQPNGGPPGSTPAQVLSAQQQPHGFPQQAIRTSAGVPVAGPGTDGAPHPQPPQVRPTVDKKAFISAVIAGGRVLGRELTPQDVVNMGHEEVMKFLRAARMRMRPNNVNQSAMGVSQRNRLQQQQQQHGGAPSNVHQSNSAPGTNNAADNIGTWLGHIGNNARTQMPMNNQNTNGLNHTMPHQANVQDQSSAAALAGKQGRPQPQQQNFHGQPGANLIGGMSNPMGVASGGTIDSQKKPGMSSAPDGLQPGPGGARVGVPPGSYQMPPGQGGGAMDANTGAAGTGVINNKGGTVSSTPGVPAVVSDEELWNKHEEIKNKFKMPLKKLFPIIHKIHETRQVRNPEHFLRQLRDSYSILDLNRNNPKPPTLTFEMLGRVEQFIHRVIQVYSKYLLQTASNSEVGPEQRRQIQITIAGFQVGSSGSTTAPTPNANGADNSTDNQQNPGAADPSSLPQRPPQVNGPVGARTMSQTALKNDPSTSNPDASGMDMQDRHAFQYQQQHRLPPRMQPGQDGQAATALNRNQMMKRHSSHQQQQQHSGQPHPTNIPGHIAENGSLDHKNTQALAQRIPPSSQRIAMAKQNANAAPGQGYGQHSGMDLGVPGAMGHRGVPMPGGPQPHSGTVDGSGRPPAPSMINPKLGQQQAQTATPNQSQNSDQTSLEPNSTSLAQATLPPQHRQQQRLPMGNQGRIPGQQPHLQQHQQQQHQQQPPHAQNQTQHHHAQQGRHVKLPGAHMADGPGGAGSGVPGKIVNRPGTVGSGGADEGQSRQTKRALTFEQRLHMLDSKVKDAIDRVQQLEACVEQDSKRSKSERIHNTLAALRNNAGVTNSAVSGGSGNGAVKRQASLVDVDNFDPKVGSVRSKTVFECSYESGLRLAKRPKNEAADLKSLREAVEADCKAAKQRNPLLMIEIREEFGQPVVTCLLKIPQIRLPKLVLRVQRGYPRKGGATYGFERPPMGWVGVLDEIRTRFKQALATAPAASVGVAAFLDAWAQEADAVINGSKMSDSR